MSRLKEVAGHPGILGMEIAFPKNFVKQAGMEGFLGRPPGNFTIGLRSLEMGIPSEDEDALALALSAVVALLRRFSVDTSKVKRLDAGSETHFDSAKPLRSFLLKLFPQNSAISGSDHVSACYGGTAALLDTLYWMSSPFYSGELAVVVATDVAIYLDENLQSDSCTPTGGAGAVAILLGPNAPLTLAPGLFHHSAHVFDFMKPKRLFPATFVSGKASIDGYIQSFTSTFREFSSSCQQSAQDGSFDFLCMHAPYAKLPLKVSSLLGIPEEKILPSLYIAGRNGNSYTASVYMALISLLGSPEFESVVLSTGSASLLVFSFGSGMQSTLFKLQCTPSAASLLPSRDEIIARLDQRSELSPAEAVRAMATWTRSSIKGRAAETE